MRNNTKYNWNENIRTAINSITQIIHSTLDFDEIMKRTVSEAAKAIGSETAAISLRNGERWTVSYIYGFPDSVIGAEMNDEEELHAVLAIKTKKPVVVNDAFNDERVNRNHMKKWGIRSVLVVPLIIRDEVIGVIFFNFHKSIFVFENIHIDFAVQLAASVSLALENSRLFKNLEVELTERRKAEEALHRAYEELQIRSGELQASYEELQIRSEELEEAYEVLSESEERYRMLFTNMTEGFVLAEIIYDKSNKPYDYRYLEINPAFELKTGIKRDRLLGKSVLEVFPNPNPVEMEKLSEVALSGRPACFEIFSQAVNKYFDIYVFSPEKGKIASIFRDITGHKLAEREAAQQSRLLNLSYDAILIRDVMDRITYWNIGASEVYGYTEEEALGRIVHELLQTEFPQSLEEILEMLYQDSRWTGELIHTRKDGRKIIVSTRWVLDRDPQDNHISILETNSDITERKQAEEALQKSESDLKKAQEIAHMGSWEWDLASNMVTGSDELYRIFSLTPDPATFFQQYVALLVPEDKQRVLDALNETIKRNVPYSIDYQVALHNGNKRFIHAEAVTVYNKGRPVKMIGIAQDVTKRKAEELELSHQRELLQKIFDNIPVLLVIWDPHLEQFMLNRYTEKVLGWATADANDGDFMSKVYPDPAYRAEVSSYMLSLQTGWREWIVTTKNGQQVPIGWANVFLTDDTMIGIGVDLRERKKAEARLKETLDNLENLVKERTAELEKAYNSLKESERSLAEAQRISHIGNWEFDIATDKLYWSDEMYRIFGRNSQECITYDKFYSYVHPEDAEYVYNSIREAFNGKIYATEFRIVRPGGEERIVYSEEETIFDEKHNLVRLRGTLQDVTERKIAEESLRLSEEKYRLFMQNFQGIAFQANENFTLQFLHGAIKEITGYTEEEFISKNPWKEIIDPEFLPALLEGDRKIRKDSGSYTRHLEFRIKNRDGKIKWVHEICNKVPGKCGKPEIYQGVIYDITQRKQAEEALAKYETARQKEIHHRIKNNLQVISSLLDLQAEKFISKEYVDRSEVIAAFKESQDRVMSIALIHKELHEGKGTDKLNFSRYLQRLADNLFQTYKLESANVSLNLDIEENIFFDTDVAVPLGMVVNEIISNSFKYAFSGRNKGEIQIKLHKNKDTKAGNTGYILNISDNGIGIPENIDFENPETLGLQLVNILVDEIDGSIEFKRNQGTEFIIFFSPAEE